MIIMTFRKFALWHFVKFKNVSNPIKMYFKVILKAKCKRLILARLEIWFSFYIWLFTEF